MLHRPSHRGFTIMEMMVAIAIMTMVVFMVHQLFNATSRAVSTGMKTGELLVESETIGDQLQRDAEHMLGPNSASVSNPNEPAGFLVIVNRTIPDATVNRRGKELHEGDEFNWPAIRSDILMFVTESGDGFQSITPQNGDTFGSTLSANHGRVWYGHALRTTPNDDYLGEGMNRVANYWTLGRQQLLLGAALNDTLDTHATNFMWAATVAIVPADAPSVLFGGVTDVTPEPLIALTGSPSLVDWMNGNSGAPPSYTYTDRIRPLYMDDGAIEPLRVNPSPDGMDFESWQMAQMHGQMAGNVSDFIVEFAGDFNGDGRIDHDNGDILWYTADRFANDGSAVERGDVRPLTEPFESYTNTGPSPHMVYSEDVTDGVAFVWRHDDHDPGVPTASKWPHLIRVRYRMHDGRGDVVHAVDGIDGGLAGQWFEHIIKVARPQDP